MNITDSKLHFPEWLNLPTMFIFNLPENNLVENLWRCIPRNVKKNNQGSMVKKLNKLKSKKGIKSGLSAQTEFI